MAIKSGEKKSKLILKTALFGAISAALYAAVFTHSTAIVQFFAKGGVYAALPGTHGVCVLLRSWRVRF